MTELAGTIKHVVMRDGVYQYQRRVPQKVIDRPAQFDALFGGNKQFRRSLKTKDHLEALENAVLKARDFEARVKQALGQVLVPATPTRPVTAEFLRKVQADMRYVTARPFRDLAVHREGSSEAAEELERMLHDLELDAEHFRDVLERNAPTKDPRLDIAALADGVILENGVHAPLGSVERSAVQKAVRDGVREGYREGGEYATGVRSVLPSVQGRTRPNSSPRITEVVTAYELTLTARRTKVELQGALRAFVAAVGDLPLDEIQRSHVSRFCQVEGAKQIGGKSRNSVARPVSSETLGKKIGLLRAAVFKATKRMTYEGANPFAGVDPSSFTAKTPPSIMPRKRPFTVDELNLIFQHPWFSGCASATNIHERGDHRLAGMHYWVPVLAAFTGCRAGELGGLMVNEVMIGDRCPHIVIQSNQFRATKGAYDRKVPLLDQLLELGFADFVATARAENRVRLFDDWKAPAGRPDTDDPAWSNGAVIRSFNQTVIPKALASSLRQGARRQVTFHSFRGAFKTLLTMQRYGIQTNYVHEVVGHEKFHLDARYVGEIPLDETYPAVRGCRYDGLVIPPLR